MYCTGFLVIYNINFNIFRKVSECDNFFIVIQIPLIFFNANNCNNMWKNTTKQQITKKIACSEKRPQNRKENVQMSNNQEMSLQ